ncbi:unnamed protein product [Aphanomyces euteiches]
MDAQLILAATTASAILGAFLIRYLLQPHPLDKLPGPKARSFLFGHALDSIGSVADWRNNDTYPEPYLKWAREYGGAYHIRELGMHVLQLTDPKAIQHVLITNAPNYSRDTLFDSYFSDIMFGNGLLSTNGAAHDGMRKILTPLFTTSRIKTFLPIFVNQTKRFCDQLPCDKAINMAEAFQKLTLGVIALAAFGFDFDAHPEAFEAFQASQLEFTPFTLIGIFLIPNFLRWPLPQLLRRRKAHNVLKKVMQDVINQKPESYPACARDKVLEIFLADITLGAGLLSTSGTTHDKYRKMLNPLFTPNQIKQFVPIYESQARRVCDTVLAPAAKSGKAIDLADVIGLAGFGFDFESNPEAHLAYLDGHLEITPLILIGSYLIPNFLSYPLPSLLHRRKAQAKIRKVVNDVIEHKLASKQDPNRPKDLLDLFLPHSSTTEAIFHTMTFLQAGHETTCSALSWIFAALITYPDAAAKVRQEYKETVAKYGSLDSWEAVSSLKYTLAVIQETMRLNVVVYMVVRRTFMQDDYVPMQEGPSVFVPAGTTIEVNIAALNRHPKYWAQADTFIPERFLEGTSEWDVDLKLRDGKSHAFYYVPFSAGSKNCIGQRFALVEMQVTVATLFGRFGFALTGDANLGAKYNGTVLFPAKLEVIVQSIE